MQLVIQDPLAFPAGRAPGFDPKHVAGGSPRFSGIPASTSFINLLTGLPGVPANTTTSGSNGLGGPSVVFPNGTSVVSFAGPFPKNDTAQTIAAIMKPTGFSCPFSSSGTASQGCFAQINSGGNPYFNISGQYQFTNITVPSGVIFIVLSAVNIGVANSNVNCLLLNMANGEIQTQSMVENSVGQNTTDGTYQVGNRPNGSSNNCSGGLFATMYSARYLTIQQMLQWAQAPWDFWYPPSDIEAEIKGGNPIFWGYANDFAAVINRFNMVSY